MSDEIVDDVDVEEEESRDDGLADVGDAYDKLDKNPDEKITPEEPKEDAKPEDAKLEPETKPAEDASALLQAREQTLQAKEQEVNSTIEQINATLGDPLFQEIRQEMAARKRSGGTESANMADKSNQPQDNPLADFTPETSNEQVLHDFLMQQHDVLEEMRESMSGRLDGYERVARANANQRMDSQIDAACEELRGNYPDLIDGGKKQDELVGQAAALIDAHAMRNRSMSLQDGLKMAARMMALPELEERARKDVMAKASASANAAVSEPNISAAPSSESWENQAMREYEELRIG